MSDTNAGKKYYVSDAAVGEADLANEAAFEALTWHEIGPDVGSFPAFGATREAAVYNGQRRKHHGFGAPNYGAGDMELPYADGDAGQDKLLAHAQFPKLVYAIKVVHGDSTGSASGDKTATTDYLRVKIAGPTYPDGQDTDRVRRVFALGFEQHLHAPSTTIA